MEIQITHDWLSSQNCPKNLLRWFSKQEKTTYSLQELRELIIAQEGYAQVIHDKWLIWLFTQDLLLREPSRASAIRQAKLWLLEIRDIAKISAEDDAPSFEGTLSFINDYLEHQEIDEEYVDFHEKLFLQKADNVKNTIDEYYKASVFVSLAYALRMLVAESPEDFYSSFMIVGIYASQAKSCAQSNAKKENLGFNQHYLDYIRLFRESMKNAFNDIDALQQLN